MIYLLADPRMPHVNTATGHYMSPLGVFTLLLLALIIDYTSAGPDSIRDIVAFTMALPAIADGWSGQWLAKWTVGWLGGVLETGMKHSGSEYMATISGAGMIGVMLGLLVFFATFCIIPAKIGAKFKVGKLSGLTFRSVKFGKKKGGIEDVADEGASKRRLCFPLWACAIILGLLWPLAMGWAGDILQFEINSFAWVWKPIPNKLFGAP